ncbi:MAG TPA: ribosomal protein S18-alanine N-acetyltransferase [Candidatus Angelobacter sp.]
MVRVRPGVASDLNRLTEIARRSATAAQWRREEYERLFTREITNAQARTNARALLVVEQDGQVMGFIVGRAVAGEWEIENVAISGPARRRGLGSHLLGEFLNLVRARGGSEIFLEVRESNQAARKLYEKWAFVEAGRRKAYYQDPQEDALILRFSFPTSARVSPEPS